MAKWEEGLAVLMLGLVAGGGLGFGYGRWEADAVAVLSNPEASRLEYESEYGYAALVGGGFGRPSEILICPARVASDHAVASEVTLSDEVPVLGVSFEGRHRAYLLETLEGFAENHLLKDKLGSHEFIVSYCDMTGCGRVLRTDGVEVQVGGFHEGLLLKVGDAFYGQLSPSLPLEDHPFEITTWADWRRAHPDTEVYTGEKRTKASHGDRQVN